VEESSDHLNPCACVHVPPSVVSFLLPSTHPAAAMEPTRASTHARAISMHIYNQLHQLCSSHTQPLQPRLHFTTTTTSLEIVDRVHHV
jgi:hypothetical protein